MTSSSRLRRRALPAVVAVLTLLALALLPPPGALLSTDTFLHLHVGEHMLESRQVAATDPGNRLHDGPYIDHEWIPQLVMAAIVRVAGLDGLFWLLAVTLAILFGGLADWLARARVEPAVILISLSAGLGALLPLILIRPFLVTWVLAVLFAGLLDAFLGARLDARPWLILTVLTTVAWANLHAGFLLAFVLIITALAATLWRAAFLPSDREASLHRAGVLGVGLASSVLASGLNRFGFELHSHFLAYMANTELVTTIDEWQAPIFHHPALLPPLAFIAISLAAALLAPSRRRPVWRPVLLVVVLLMALRAQRNLAIFILLSMPLLALDLQALLETLRPARSKNERSPGVMNGPLGGVALLVGLLGLLTAAVVRHRPVEPDPRRFPVAAADVIATNSGDFGAEVFNFYGWGGYLSWRLDRPMFINGLHDHYPEAQYRQYEQIFELGPRWQRELEESGVKWAIFPAHSTLDQALELHPDWQPVFRDRTAVIHRRITTARPGAGDGPADSPPGDKHAGPESPEFEALVEDRGPQG